MKLKENIIQSYQAEQFCCQQMNKSELFVCQRDQEGPLRYTTTDLNCLIKNEEHKEFRIQVKNRKTIEKDDSIIFKKVIGKKDLKNIEKRIIPYIITCFDSSKPFTEDKNPGYIIKFNDLKKQINKKAPSGKLR